MKKKEIMTTSQGEIINLWNQKERIKKINDQAILDQWIQRFHVDIEAVSESNDWHIYTLIRININ